MSILCRPWRNAAILSLAVLAAGCSAFGGGPDYESSKQTRPLDMPPDLSLSPGGSETDVPQIAPRQATFSNYMGQEKDAAGEQTGGTKESSAALSGGLPGVHMKRDGAIRWLVVDAKAAALWPHLKDFFQRQGFKIAVSEPKLGVMETNWREQKAEVNDGFFSRIFQKLNSTGLRDKYRVRLEPAKDPDKTLVFITHRGLKEVAFDDTGGEHISTAWQTRPSDPELEAEMTERFLVYLGASKPQAKQVVAEAGPAVSRAKVTQVDGHLSLEVSEVFARTWRRTGLALDRLGVTVEDRDRSNGLYYIRLPKDFFKEKDKGWLASLFGGDKQKTPPQKFQLRIADHGATTAVQVLSKDGEADDSQVARHILDRLQTYLK
ncbi:MAG TPA: outer membrane protein assembly factor BamC [Gammaproteobacteria bacterium]|nr:outer membrane protein assembly factor BamC [Gammaproteobacteria bacterium]